MPLPTLLFSFLQILKDDASWQPLAAAAAALQAGLAALRAEVAEVGGGLAVALDWGPRG